jgi:hypothetical protein
MTKKNEDLRLFYQIVIDDIRYSKQQQWNTIYLTLLAIAATISLFLGIETKPGFSQSLKWFLIIVCIFIALMGIIFIGIYQGSMAKYRCKKANILKKLSEEIKDLDCDCQFCKYYRKDLIFILLFWVLIIASLFLAIWIIFNIN